MTVTDTAPKSAARPHPRVDGLTRTGGWCCRFWPPPHLRRANLRRHDTGRVAVVAVALAEVRAVASVPAGPAMGWPGPGCVRCGRGALIRGSLLLTEDSDDGDSGWYAVNASEFG